MSIIEVILIGLALGMDCFAVSICKGLSLKKMVWKKAIIIGLYFGIFQGMMPVIGYFLGRSFEDIISNVDHWIAFILLGFIGIKMIREALKEDSASSNDKADFKTMIPLAIATSIDALAVGITFSVLEVNILFAAIVIGIVSFLLPIIGVKIGTVFGDKYKKKAEIFGGTVLVIIGLRILIEGLFF